jgi:hypothetical protein
MKYATVDENNKPESTSVPMIKGRIARLMLYTTFDFCALSRMTSNVERTRVAMRRLPWNCPGRDPISFHVLIPLPWHHHIRHLNWFVYIRKSHHLHPRITSQTDQNMSSQTNPTTSSSAETSFEEIVPVQPMHQGNIRKAWQKKILQEYCPKILC